VIIVPSNEYFLAQYGASQLHLLATGLLLGIVVVLMPQGIIPAVKSIIDRLRAPTPSIRESASEATPSSEPTKAAS